MTWPIILPVPGSRAGGAPAPEMTASLLRAGLQPTLNRPPGTECRPPITRYCNAWCNLGRIKNDSVNPLTSSPTVCYPARPGLAVPSSIRDVDRCFGAADWLAIHFRKRVSAGLYWLTHIVAVLMGLSFIVYSEYDGLDWLVLVFLALFFGGVALYLWSERRQWHRKYLDYRALAEGLRVQIYWLLVGRCRHFVYRVCLRQFSAEAGCRPGLDSSRDEVRQPGSGPRGPSGSLLGRLGHHTLGRRAG